VTDWATDRQLHSLLGTRVRYLRPTGAAAGYQIQVSLIHSSQAQLCVLPMRKRPAASHLESLHFRVRKGSSGDEKLEAAMILQEQHNTC
jgi:hypothetical protein